MLAGLEPCAAPEEKEASAAKIFFCPSPGFFLSAREQLPECQKGGHDSGLQRRWKHIKLQGRFQITAMGNGEIMRKHNLPVSVFMLGAARPALYGEEKRAVGVLRCSSSLLAPKTEAPPPNPNYEPL